MSLNFFDYWNKTFVKRNVQSDLIKFKIADNALHLSMARHSRDKIFCRKVSIYSKIGIMQIHKFENVKIPIMSLPTL